MVEYTKQIDERRTLSMHHRPHIVLHGFSFGHRPVRNEDSRPGENSSLGEPTPLKRAVACGFVAGPGGRCVA